MANGQIAFVVRFSTPTAVILLDELVVALHEARVVATEMMGLKLIQCYIGDLDDHLEARAAVVVVILHCHLCSSVDYQARSVILGM